MAKVSKKAYDTLYSEFRNRVTELSGILLDVFDPAIVTLVRLYHQKQQLHHRFDLLKNSLIQESDKYFSKFSEQFAFLYAKTNKLKKAEIGASFLRSLLISAHSHILVFIDALKSGLSKIANEDHGKFRGRLKTFSYMQLLVLANAAAISVNKANGVGSVISSPDNWITDGLEMTKDIFVVKKSPDTKGVIWSQHGDYYYGALPPSRFGSHEMIMPLLS